MDKLLDYIWFKIVDVVHYLREFLDFVFGPLNALGPAFAVVIIVCITVAITKYLTKNFKTKRYIKLEKEFIHWYKIRKEALEYEDHEKAKCLAKNVDQAKLNRVYYDYFFERLMNSLITSYLPLLSMLAYVNEAYRSENLLRLFGREYILKFKTSSGNVIKVGAVFWFVISYLLINVVWFLIKTVYSRHQAKQKEPDLPPSHT